MVTGYKLPNEIDIDKNKDPKVTEILDDFSFEQLSIYLNRCGPLIEIQLAGIKEREIEKNQTKNRTNQKSGILALNFKSIFTGGISLPEGNNAKIAKFRRELMGVGLWFLAEALQKHGLAVMRALERQAQENASQLESQALRANRGIMEFLSAAPTENVIHELIDFTEMDIK